MKNVVVVAIILAALTAFSTTLCWSQENNADGRLIRYPTIQINGQSWTYDMFCRDGNTLVAKKPEKVCAEWKQMDVGQGPRCIKYEEKQVVVPMEDSEHVCKNWVVDGGDVFCSNWIEQKNAHPATIKAAVFQVHDEDAYWEQFIGTEDYKVPLCRDIAAGD